MEILRLIVLALILVLNQIFRLNLNVKNQHAVTGELKKAEFNMLFIFLGQSLDVVQNQHTEPFSSEQFALYMPVESCPPVCHALEMIINYL